MADNENGVGRKNGESRWTLERGLVIATFITSSLAFTFGLGVNWARLMQQEAEIRAIQDFDKAIAQTYLNRELYQADQRRLSDAVERLDRALEAIQGQHDVIVTGVKQLQKELTK